MTGEPSVTPISEELPEQALYFAFAGRSFVTGTTIRVDGGYEIR